MSTGFFNVPIAENEEIVNYVPGTIERARLKQTIAEMNSSVVDVPMIIDGKEEFIVEIKLQFALLTITNTFWVIITGEMDHTYKWQSKPLLQQKRNGPNYHGKTERLFF